MMVFRSTRIGRLYPRVSVLCLIGLVLLSCLGCDSTDRTSSKRDYAKEFGYLVNANVKGAWLTLTKGQKQMSLSTVKARELLGAITRGARLDSIEGQESKVEYDLLIQSGNSPYNILFFFDGETVRFTYEQKSFASENANEVRAIVGKVFDL